MKKNLSKAQKVKISAGQKDAWKDPSKRIEQKKRIEAKRLLKGAVPDQIESPNPLNIEVASQAPIDEIKKSDDRYWGILLNTFMEYFLIKQRRPLQESLNILEKAILIKVLSSVNGNQKDAAKFLGMKYTTLNEKKNIILNFLRVQSKVNIEIIRRRIKKTMSCQLFGSHHYPPFADMLRFGSVPQPSPENLIRRFK